MYCISCLEIISGEAPECPTCQGELFAYEPPSTLQAEIEKRHFLLEVLRESEQSGIIDHKQREQIAREHQSLLLHYRQDIMEELGLFDEEEEEPEEAQAATVEAPPTPESATEIVAEAKPEPDTAGGIVIPAPEVDSAAVTPLPPAELQSAEATQDQSHTSESPSSSEPPHPEEYTSTTEDVAAPILAAQPGVAIPPEGAAPLPDSAEEEEGADLLEAQVMVGDVLGEGAGNMATDPLSMPDFDESAAMQEMDRVVMEQSTWSKYLKPFLVQNWLYFLGTFLVLASGFYLLSLAWEGMQTVSRQAVIWSGLGLTGLSFAGGGAYLHRKLGVDQAGQIFWMVGAGLLGSSAIAAGKASQHSIPVFVLLLLATLAIGFVLVRLLRPFDRGISRKLTAIGMTGQLLLIAVIPVLKQNQNARFWIFTFFYLGGLLLWQTIRQLRGAIYAGGRAEGRGPIALMFSPRPARSVYPEAERPNRWDWILFVGPVGYLFLLMLGWAGWELSTVLQRRMALSWYGPLMVLIGAALLEFVVAALPTPAALKDDAPDALADDDSASTEAPASTALPFSGWVGGAIALGVSGVFIALPHPPAQLFSAGLLCVMLLYIAHKWPKQGFYFLAGVSGLFGYVGGLRTWGIEGVWSVETLALTNGINGLLFLPFLFTLFGGILWLGKRQKREGVNALRGLFLLLSLALFGIMVADGHNNPASLMWGAPIYALAYLAIAHVNQKKFLGYIGVVMAGFWFAYGPTQWFSLPSRYALSLLAFGIVCFLMARLFGARDEEGALRKVLDDGFLLALPVALVFWAQDPLFRFFEVDKALRGAGGGPWQPEGVWMLVYMGFVLYGAFMLWSTRNTGNPITAYLSLGVIALGAGLLGVATPRWLGRAIVPWRAPMFAIIGTFLLFELSRRIKGGVRSLDTRLSLFGFTSKAASETLWSRPARQFSYGLLFGSVVLVGLRDLTVTVQLVFSYAQTIFLVQAGVRQGQKRFGYLFTGMFWLLGFLQLSWIDEYTSLDPTLGYIIFFGGGCLLLSFALWGTRRWTSPEGQETAWSAIVGPVANMLPLFLLAASVWQLDQSRMWLLGKHPQPGYLFLGWLILTLSYYSLASVLRLGVFVYAGTLSFVAMGLLSMHKVWSPLELYCASTGFFAFFYAVSVLKIWQKFDSPHQLGGLWSLWRGEFRPSGWALWSRGHREVVLFFAALAIPGLFLTWGMSLSISQGSEIGKLRAVAPWVVLMASLLTAFPFLWEGYIQRNREHRRSQKLFGFALLAAGMGLALGSSAWLQAAGLNSEDPSTWAAMLGIAALGYQALMWFCRFRQPALWRLFEAPTNLLFVLLETQAEEQENLREWWDTTRAKYPGASIADPEETINIFDIWGRLWKAAHDLFLFSAFLATTLAVIALLDARGTEYAFLALLFVPLAFEQLQRPSRSSLVMVMVLGVVFWTTRTLPFGWSTTGTVVLAGLFLWKSMRQWSNVPLRSLFWLSVAMTTVGFGFCIAILEALPATMQAPHTWAGWCIALSLVALGYQAWMWLCRKRGEGFAIEDHFDFGDPIPATPVADASDEGVAVTATDDSDEQHAEMAPIRAKTTWYSLRDKGSWEGLWYASLTSFGLAAALGSICTVSAFAGSYESQRWLLCLLPFLAMLPWCADQLQRPVRDTAIPVVLLGSYGIYLTTGLFWQGTVSQYVLPIFAIAFFWVLAGEGAQFFAKKHRRRGRYFYQLSSIASAPVLFFGAVFWFAANWHVSFTSTPDEIFRWLPTGGAVLGIPLLYAWYFYRTDGSSRRSGFSFHLWLLVWVAWPMGFFKWLLDGYTSWTPGLMWAAMTMGLGFLYRFAQSNADHMEDEESLATRLSLHLTGLANWASVMGIFGLLVMMAFKLTGSPGLGAFQWFGAAAMITVGWGMIALTRGDSVRWMLQASLAGIWAVHGLLLFVLPVRITPSWVGPPEPGLFALLGALFVVIANSAAINVRKGGLPMLWQPLMPTDDVADMEEERQSLWFAIAGVFNTTALLHTILATLMVGLAWLSRLGLRNLDPLFTDGTVILAMVFLAWNWVRLALFRNKDLPAYLGVACFFGVYAYVRGVMGFGSTKIDTWLLMIIGFSSVGFRVLWQRMGGELLQRVIFRVTFVLPVIVFFVTAVGSNDPIPQGFWLLAGLFYGVVAQQYDKRILYVPSLILINIELFRLMSNVLHADPFTNMQWYALPFGFTLFAYSAIYRNQLNQTSRNMLRNIGAIAIYACSMYQVVALNNIFDVMILAVLAIAGVVAGIILHVRSYLYLGAAFLVLDITVNLFRIGLNDRIIGMVFLFITGILVLASAVFFNLKRDEILRKYKEWREEVASWD